MARIRGPIAVAAILCAVLLIASVAGATPPRKGVRYAGLITVQHGSGRTFEFPLSFSVDPSGQEVGPFVFEDGAPFGTRCAEGPLGEPETGRRAAVEHGGFDVFLPLVLEHPEEVDGQDIGGVHLAGTFGKNGVFAGELENRTSAKICRGAWKFKLHAQSR